MPAQLLGLHAASGDPLGDPSWAPPPVLAFLIAVALAALVGLAVIALVLTTSLLVMAVTATTLTTVTVLRAARVVVRVAAIVTAVAAAVATAVAIAAVAVPLGLCVAASTALVVRVGRGRPYPRADVDARLMHTAPATSPADAGRPTRTPTGETGAAGVADAA